MKTTVKMHLKVDAEAFFDVLRESLAADIAEARGKKTKLSNVHEGYSYKKYLGGKRDAAHTATVRIACFDAPRRYRSTIETSQGTTTMGYDVVPGEEGGIDVTYVEEFASLSYIQNAIQRMTGFARAVTSKGRIRAQLQAIEGKILAEAYPAEPQGEAAADEE